jgi:hypothetical protein
MKNIKLLVKNIKYLLKSDLSIVILKKNIYKKANNNFVHVVNIGGSQLLLVDDVFIPKIETTVITQEPMDGEYCHVTVSFKAKVID